MEGDQRGVLSKYMLMDPEIKRNKDSPKTWTLKKYIRSYIILQFDALCPSDNSHMLTGPINCMFLALQSSRKCLDDRVNIYNYILTIESYLCFNHIDRIFRYL